MKRISRVIMISLGILTSFSTCAFADTLGNDKFKNDIYEHMINRDEVFYFTYHSDSALDLLQEIAKKDDYLERSISVYKTMKSGYLFKAEMGYRTTKEQEEYIDSELERIVNNLIDSRMTVEEKVKAINDYIVKIYKYDDTLKSDNVYTALTTKTTICQGYAMTAYKMFKLMGIDCRIVNGDRDGTSHAWNLVNVNGTWYHLDITNNDNIVRDRYLLKSDDFMRENKYTWNSDEYPIAPVNYYEGQTEYIDYNNDKEMDIAEYYEGGYWYKDEDSKWHYRRDSGYEAVGWFKYDDNWYYFDDNGIMKTGWVNTDGNWYYFYSDGKLAVNTTIDGHTLNENGALY